MWVRGLAAMLTVKKSAGVHHAQVRKHTKDPNPARSSQEVQNTDISSQQKVLMSSRILLKGLPHQRAAVEISFNLDRRDML